MSDTKVPGAVNWLDAMIKTAEKMIALKARQERRYNNDQARRHRLCLSHVLTALEEDRPHDGPGQISGHKKAVLDRNGRAINLIAASSPSDYRGTKNFEAFAKRQLRGNTK
jgi:hypothetical protein